MTDAARTSIDPDEVERFSRIAAEWWDPHGKFAPLHKFNPVRLQFIREQALRRFGRDEGARTPFGGLRLLDIGCGGGLLSEPMRRRSGWTSTIAPARPKPCWRRARRPSTSS